MANRSFWGSYGQEKDLVSSVQWASLAASEGDQLGQCT